MLWGVCTVSLLCGDTMSGCGERGTVSAGFWPEEVKSSDEEVEASENEEDHGSERAERKPVNIESENVEAPFAFPRDVPTLSLATAPVGRAAQSPPLISAFRKGGEWQTLRLVRWRASATATRSTASVSSGRATPVSVASGPG